MFYLSCQGHPSSLKNLLVFDNAALLGANPDNPQLDWLNYQRLGNCYIPSLTLVELLKWAKKGHQKAKHFIKFISEWQNYEILYRDNNLAIPLTPTINLRDRHILTCTFKLAEQRRDAAVILITHPHLVATLENQQNLEPELPNFCAIDSQTLAWWSHEGVYRQQLPEPIVEVNQRLESTIHDSQSQKLENSNTAAQILQKQLKSRSVINTLPLDKAEWTTEEEETENKSRVVSLSTASIAAATTLLLVGGLAKQQQFPVVASQGFFAPNITNFTSNSQQDKAQVSTEVANAIEDFRRTKDPSFLRVPLEELRQREQQKQLKLDEKGVQMLSSLKHKYAIEVLASSGNLPEAAQLLQEIPDNYTKISAVNNWLEQYSF